jgi:hypothetical protein
MNHLHRVHLIDAELQRVSGDKVDAIESYDLAIELAHANNYIQAELIEKLSHIILKNSGRFIFRVSS